MNIAFKMNKQKNNISLIAFLFTLLLLVTCEKNALIQLDDMQLSRDKHLTPFIDSKRGDKEVTLIWGQPICFELSCPKFNPDYFEILMSKSDINNLDIYAKVDRNIYNFTIPDLENEVIYYFAIRSIQEGRIHISDTIMVIPDKPKKIITLFSNIGESRELGSYSFDQQYVAYMAHYFWGNGNYKSQSVFIFELAVNMKLLVEKSSRSPRWSPKEYKITYQTSNGEINSGHGTPTHIAVYNLQDSTIERVTSGDTFNYLPIWSPDGKWIAFVTANIDHNVFSIYKIPSDNGQKTQLITDLTDFPQGLSWSSDGNSIAFEYQNDIYTVPSNGGLTTKLINSPWMDCCPAYSPDGNKLAFISNRSGRNNLWLLYVIGFLS